ncbi:hypothetical protein [Brevibacillus sp. BC25]|uniref:hypothetical protein n=1 Tax=Brevibacillus sp. BC25 TaxID=1144308 RepID=UPI000270E570|nr:hypothetical protein [Brevibacillus sp. BC25]EJL29090.1 hypothetical protein PMI05_01874 [Brevibacillus sp. BC25]
MIHESNEVKKIEINDVATTFSEIYNKPYFPKEYEEEIKKANVLLIPYEKFRVIEGPVFPEETRDFFEYLRENSVKFGVISDICISDEKFQALELHADVMNLPEMLVNLYVLPITINLVSSYLYEKMRTRKSDLKIKVGIVVESNGSSKRISYEGDADKFKETIETVSKELFNK